MAVRPAPVRPSGPGRRRAVQREPRLTESALEFRPAEPDDLPVLETIRAAAFAPVFASLRDALGETVARSALAGAEEEQAGMLEALCGPDSEFDLFVACEDGEPVGFISYTAHEGKKLGEIGLNAVHPRYAGRGIGTRMYEFALDALRAAGMEVVEVATGSDPGHAPARRAYEKAGFAAAVPALFLYRKL